ncbi:unnamed protein product [Closterium sp. Naga37s-1]|nr:unnamed protein product [Closterium sp. Naga37s-1]
MSCIENPGETGWESVRRALEEKASQRLDGRRSLEHHAIGAVKVLQRRLSNCGAAEILERIQMEGEEVTDEQDGDNDDDSDGGARCEAAGGADLRARPVTGGGSARWWPGWAGPARLDAAQAWWDGAMRDKKEEGMRARWQRMGVHLRYLHARSIVHRDLKTDNLLLDQKHRVVKIADFGVSRVEPGDCSMKRRTGTYGYMAPEVLKEQPYDHMADVYSYGIVLWEIVTCGNPFPFEGLKPEQVCSMVNQGLRPDIPSSCPPPLADLMRRCWHHTPARRPDMCEVVQRLRGLSLQCAPAIPACACM